MTETISTYFARLAGRPTLTVNANGNACPGGYGPNTYPLGIPINLKASETLSGNQGTQRYHRVFRSNGSELMPTHPHWNAWKKMTGMTIYLPISNSDDMSGTHIGWLDWTPGSNGTNELDAAMTFPGTLQSNFNEGTPQDPSLPNIEPLGQFQLGDWVAGNTGERASLSDDMSALMSPPGMSGPRIMILPMYDKAGGTGSNGAFHVVQMGYFEFVGFDMGSRYGQAPPADAPNNQKYIMVRYMGQASGAPEECASEAPGTTSNPKRFTIQGTTKVNRVFAKHISDPTYDILLVMDVSTSMQRDWNDGTSGPARAEDAKRALLNFIRGYNVQGDPDARMAYVSFGGTGTNAVITEQGWSTACSTPQTDCGTDANKWSGIQTKITNMTHRGGTPGAMAFERVEELLRSRRTPASGKQYVQVVIFATDGIFNVCGSEIGQEPCPWGTKVNGNVAQNLVSGRPIWQAQQVAARIKATWAAPMAVPPQIYMVTLVPNCSSLTPDEDCFTTTGLPEMSSGTGYYYSARDGSSLDGVYGQIGNAIPQPGCRPGEKIDPAVGARMVVMQPNNPTSAIPVEADNDGVWRVTGVEAGQYVVKVDPAYAARSPEDNLWRTYSRVRNWYDLNEETQASILINPQFPNGATVYSEVRVSMPIGTDEAPVDGCNSGRNSR